MLSALDPILAPLTFWLLALAAVVCGGGVLLSRHPLNGAINLIGVMLALAGLYALLGSPFLGVIQVLTYAGAIMMLVVFVIMVLNRARDHEVPTADWYGLLVLPLPLALAAGVVRVLARTPMAPSPEAVRGEPEAIAAAMFDLAPTAGGWWLLFEVTGVLLLVAAVGAVLLAKRELTSRAEAAAAGGDKEHGHDAH